MNNIQTYSPPNRVPQFSWRWKTAGAAVVGRYGWKKFENDELLGVPTLPEQKMT